MKRALHTALTIAFLVPAAGWTQEDPVPTPEPIPTYENEPVYQNNTGALGTGGNTAADITNEDGEAVTVGMFAGEITIQRTETGVEIFSGMNKVEAIPEGSDGWVGRVETGSSSIRFQPSGRPWLRCPRQVADWFGPCKVEGDE